MKHKIALLFTALFLAVGLSWALMLPAGEGATYYVNGNYTGGGNDGSSSKPFTTISAALTALTPADGYVTINIAAGTYNEILTLSRGKVALVGQGATTIIGDVAESGNLHPVLTIGNRHINVSNLTVKGNKRAAGNTSGRRDVATIVIDNSASETDPITIENVTVNVGGNTGAGILVDRNDRNASISKVVVNGHSTGIYVNATCSIDDVTLNGDAGSEYGVYVNNGPVTLNKIVASGYSRAALMYDYSRGVSTLTNSKLSDSAYGLRMQDGELSVSNTEIYGKGNDEPVYVRNESTLTLGEGTKLYRSFDRTRDNNFIAYDHETKVVTDNGAQFFYGTNYSQSRVIKVYDRTNRQQQNLLRNAYPVGSIESVFALNRDGDGNRNLSSGWTVVLPAGDAITLDEPLRVYTRITLDGSGVTLKGQPVIVDNYRDDTGTATIQNLTISDIPTSVNNPAIMANRNLTLTDVTLTNGVAALAVNNSKVVTATNLTTSQHTLGGVFLNTGAELNIISGDHIGDFPAVATPQAGYSPDEAVTTDGVAWKALENTAATGYNSMIKYFWVRVPSVTTPPAGTPVIYHEQLWNSVLTGGEVKYDNETVTGRFVWKQPDYRIEGTESSYPCCFIPDNQKKFYLKEEAISLQVNRYYEVTTVVSEEGKVVIKNAKPDNLYLPGDVLELEAVPFGGYTVGTFRVSRGSLGSVSNEKATYTVGSSDAVISHTFAAIQPTTTVTYSMNPADGAMAVYTEDGTPVASRTGVVLGTRLYVLVYPAAGKALKSMTYYYGTPVLNGYITAGEEPIIIQTVIENCPLTSSVIGYAVPTGMGAFVHFHDNDGNIYMPGMAIPNGAKITPVITSVFGKQLASYTIGGAYYEVINGVTALTIERDMLFVPSFTDVVYPVSASIDNAAAGTVSLNKSEGKNGTRVVATIRINGGYKLLTVIANGKELRPSRIRRSSNVEADVDIYGATTIRVITRKLETLAVDLTQQVYTLYDKTVNSQQIITKALAPFHPFIVRGIPAGLERTGRFTVSYREHTSVGSFTDIPNQAGTYDVKIEREADNFYQELSVVVESGLKIQENYYPLRDLTRTKTNPTAPELTAMVTYDGSVFGDLAANPVAANDWVVTYRQQNIPVLYPVNAGTYDIIGFRAADTLYNVQTNVSLGTLTINKAVSNASVTYATDILQGQSLAASRLSGNANIDGTFSWMAPETKMTVAGSPITTQKALFTPYSSNYTTDTNLATSLNVLAMAAGNLRTITVNLTNDDKGTYELTREGIAVAAGTIITAGERIRISFDTTDPAYTAVLKINGVQYPNGTTYTVDATGDMVISLDFMPIGQAPALIGVTGIHLSSREKSATEGEVFRLTPSITPSNASDQRVTWTSSDRTVATVNADGNVTVLKAGNCIITATVTSTGHTATCLLTTSPTGNEAALAGVKVYSLDKQYICIEAAEPVKVVIADVLGRIVYRGTVGQRQLVDLPTGTYFVIVANQNYETTVKVVL